MYIGETYVSGKKFTMWVSLAVLLLVSFTWTVCALNFVENYEYGFIFDKFSGKFQPVEHTGWIVVNPVRYSVHKIDIRPYQVSISANQRVLNAKLIKFNPEGIATFVDWHGRAAGDNLENLKEILKCYAFDRDEGRDCPFLTVISVLAPSQGGQPVTESKEWK